MKYINHDTSAMEDEKLAELFVYFGYEGYGLFWAILERLAKQEKPIKTTVLKKQLRVGKKLEKCWCFMEEIGLINKSFARTIDGINKLNAETFNKQLLNYAGKYRLNNEKNAKRISEWRKNQHDIENVTEYMENTNEISNTPVTPLNRSKVKEIEVKNREVESSAIADPPKILKSIEEKSAEEELDFYNILVKYTKEYDPKMIREFYDYWRERTKSGAKMRFQLNKTWDISLRLQKWKSKSEQWSGNKKIEKTDSPTKIVKDGATLLAETEARQRENAKKYLVSDVPPTD